MALLLSRKHTECLCFDSHLYSFDLPILCRDDGCTNKLCRFSYPLTEIIVKRTRAHTRPRLPKYRRGVDSGNTERRLSPVRSISPRSRRRKVVIWNPRWIIHPRQKCEFLTVSCFLHSFGARLCDRRQLRMTTRCVARQVSERTVRERGVRLATMTQRTPCVVYRASHEAHADRRSARRQMKT